MKPTLQVANEMDRNKGFESHDQPPNVIALGYDPGDGSGWDEECAFLILDEQALRRRLAEHTEG